MLILSYFSKLRQCKRLVSTYFYAYLNIVSLISFECTAKGSFKFRGALNAVRSIISDKNISTEKDNIVNKLNVVTHSSGNHAQALALAAKLSSTKRCEVNATIVMPNTAPDVKVKAVKSYGAEIIMVDNTNEARESKADEIVISRKSHFIHPSEDARVIAGQGTVCLEMVDQVRKMENSDLDIVIIPVGGGGLASGNIIALRALLGKSVKIVLAEPSSMDDAKRSFYSGKKLGHDPSNPLNSIADGLKTTLGDNTWPIVRDFADDIIAVSEADILLATKLIWERLKVCIEPSAGVGVAVVLGDEFRTNILNSADVDEKKTLRIGIILCGGNVDVIKIAALIGTLN